MELKKANCRTGLMVMIITVFFLIIDPALQEDSLLLSHQGSPILIEQIQLNRHDVKMNHEVTVYHKTVTSWEIDGETVETVADFIFRGLQNHCRW